MTGFLKGLLVGLVSFGLGLGVLAVVLPPDLRVSIDPVVEAALPPVLADDEPAAEPAALDTPEPAPELAVAPEAEPTSPEPPAPDLSAAPSAEQTAADVAPAPEVQESVAQEPMAQAEGQPSFVPEVVQDLASSPPDQSMEPAPEAALAPLAPADPPRAPAPERTAAPEITPLPEPLAQAEPAAEPENTAAPATEPAPLAEAAVPTPEPEPRILRAVPTTLLDRQVEGVVTGRLPRIGAEPTDDIEETPQTTAELPALSRFAADFEASADLPRLSVILIDAPSAQEAVIALPFALTIAVDPDAPDAAARAALYRAAGHEVALLALGLPAGATASDLAVTFSEWHRILPEAVVLIDTPEGGGLTGDRMLAQAVMPYLSERGLGLITPDLGLNQAAQVAQAAGVPQASLFRRIDTGDEGEALIRRFLTRAAFEAQAQGQAVVLGRAEHAPTLAALIGWRLEMRARQVSLVPVSALLDPGAIP